MTTHASSQPFVYVPGCLPSTTKPDIAQRHSYHHVVSPHLPSSASQWCAGSGHYVGPEYELGTDQAAPVLEWPPWVRRAEKRGRHPMSKQEQHKGWEELNKQLRNEGTLLWRSVRATFWHTTLDGQHPREGVCPSRSLKYPPEPRSVAGTGNPTLKIALGFFLIIKLIDAHCRKPGQYRKGE